jgi:hypothetical protein
VWVIDAATLADADVRVGKQRLQELPSERHLFDPT